MHEPPPEPRLFARPVNQLATYPVKYRWEFTRRHPYYYHCWELARDYRQVDTAASEEQLSLRYLAYRLLVFIGVTGEPVDPKTPFEELDKDLAADPGLLSGPIQPMTYRAIMQHVIAALPQEDLVQLAKLLIGAGSPDWHMEGDDANHSMQREAAMAMLARTPSSALDSYRDAPLYYIHMESPQRMIEASLKHYVKKWKERQRKSEKRIHTKKLDLFLETWDAREGWANGAYDCQRSESFDAMARRRRTAKATLINQHHTVFEYIVGTHYSFEAWTELFAWTLLGSDGVLPAQRFLRRFAQLARAQSGAAVPETTIQSVDEHTGKGGGFIESLSAYESSDHDEVDAFLDAVYLMQEDWSNERIAAELEVPLEHIQLFRERFNESQPRKASGQDKN